jgi:hypothetical protein
VHDPTQFAECSFNAEELRWKYEADRRFAKDTLEEDAKTMPAADKK